MIRGIGRVLGAVLRVVLVVVVLSVVVSVLASLAVTDVAPGDDGIDTPEPLPDWPFVWEVPSEDHEIETDPQGEPPDGEYGEPVREDPGTTSIDTRDGTVRSDEVERQVHRRVNEIRADNGLPALAHDDEIASVARTYSHDMGERGYFSHVSPEGETPVDRMDEFYPRRCSAVGENLALVGTAGSVDAGVLADRIVTGWMRSAGHRENILTARWDSQGIGVYLDGEGRVFATQKFCDER